MRRSSISSKVRPARLPASAAARRARRRKSGLPGMISRISTGCSGIGDPSFALRGVDVPPSVTLVTKRWKSAQVRGLRAPPPTACFPQVVGRFAAASKWVGGSPVVSMMLDKFEDVVGECELRLQVPPTVEHLRTVRLVAADAADRAGFDCDETDELRIAVDEVCHAVLQSTEAPITLGFSTEPGIVRVTGAAHREGALRPLHMPRLSQLIVDAVSDDVEIVDGSADIRFTLVKRAGRSYARSG